MSTKFTLTIKWQQLYIYSRVVCSDYVYNRSRTHINPHQCAVTIIAKPKPQTHRNNVHITQKCTRWHRAVANAVSSIRDIDINSLLCAHIKYIWFTRLLIKTEHREREYIVKIIAKFEWNFACFTAYATLLQNCIRTPQPFHICNFNDGVLLSNAYEFIVCVCAHIPIELTKGRYQYTNSA